MVAQRRDGPRWLRELDDDHILRDHGHGASASRVVAVYFPAEAHFSVSPIVEGRKAVLTLLAAYIPR